MNRKTGQFIRTGGVLMLALGALLLFNHLSQTAQATHGSFAPGDVFVATKSGEVQWRHSDGTLVKVLPASVAGAAVGLGFDAAGNLYVSHSCVQGDCSLGNTVEVFDRNGISRGAFGSGYNCNPFSIVFDRVLGQAFVGQLDCTGNILKFDSAGNPLASLNVLQPSRGAPWIDLASDNCTIFYTSYQGSDVLRYNSCTGQQLSSFNSVPLPGPTHDLRILPDGGVLVATEPQIVRLNSQGNIVQTYDVAGEPDVWFGLDTAGDGTFWVSNFFSGRVFRLDMATGTVLGSFGIGTAPGDAKEVKIFPPKPPPPPVVAFGVSINVTDITITRADLCTAEGFFRIANTAGGGQSVQIESIRMRWQSIGPGGRLTECRNVSFNATAGPGTIISPEQELTVNYSIQCLECSPGDTREIKNFVEVTITGRPDQVFGSSGSFKLGPQ